MHQFADPFDKVVNIDVGKDRSLDAAELAIGVGETEQAVAAFLDGLQGEPDILHGRVAQLAGRVGWVADPTGDISGLSYGLGVSWNSLSLDWGSMPQASVCNCRICKFVW